MMTVSSAWTMPQHRRSGDYDTIDPDFPPPSLKPAPEKRKKTRKWSIGGLFRRKKKASDTDSSSPLDDEEEKKGFLERRRAARKKRNRGSKDVTDAFEHVVLKPSRPVESESLEFSERLGRSQESLPRRLETRGSSVSLDGGRRGRVHGKARPQGRLKGESSSDEESSRTSSASVQRRNEDSGSLSRRSRAARTERYKKRLSRDDESLRDFQLPSRVSRSDERLTRKKEAPSNRWTAKVVYYESSDYDTKYTAITKSATPSPIQSPKGVRKNPVHYTASAPPGSTYVTYPPREGVAGSHQELRRPGQRYADVTPPRLPKASSEMISRPPSAAPHPHPGWPKDPLNRKSASYDCNVNSLHYVNNQISHPHPSDDNVLVVQFPISRPIQKDKKIVSRLSTTPTLQYFKQTNPPPPPPRDPHRRVMNGNHQESSPRPMSYAFEDRNQHTKYSGYPEFGSRESAFHRVPQLAPIEFQPTSSMNKQHRSSSDHQIPSRINAVKSSPPTTRRPSSVQQEIVPRSLPLNVESSPPSEMSQTSPPQAVPHHYHYYTDQQPRSRRPIHIACPSQKPAGDSYLSDSQVVVKPPVQQTSRPRPAGVQNASDFWKQKDQESARKVHLSEGSPKLIHRHLLTVNSPNERSRSISPRSESHLVSSKLKLPPLIMPARTAESASSISSQSSPRDISSPRTPVSRKPGHNEIGIPIFDGSDLIGGTRREYRPLSMLEERQETTEQDISPIRDKPSNPPTPPTRKDSKVNAVTNFEHFDIFDDDNDVKDGRNSSNLEEALNELEAIYKSLRLGEEGYLEKMAREQALYENTRLDPSNWNAWVQSRGFESDSSFNYSRSSLESVDSIDSPIKRPVRRPGVPDRVADDMAFRRFNKIDRPPPLEQEVISQAGSFLLVSPTLSPPPFIEPPPLPPVKNEPDVTLDDVVYRNIKHVNNNLKITDPQPPFGIPLGPIAPAANSDYLHATPTEIYRPTFKPRRTPDVVSDDLAFRNLRKDSNKEPHFSSEDTTLIDSPSLKKKRAVRSLSANLLSIIQKESLAMNNNRLMYNNNRISGELEKSQSFTDVTDAINGKVPMSQFVEHVHLVEPTPKRIPSGEESDATTPRASRHFYTETSSPSIATSTETLVGSKSSLLSQDTKIQKLSRTSSPRLSLTPERRHTTDSVHLLRASASPVKHVPIKLESFKTPSIVKPQDFRRSPTPDSHTHTHQIDSHKVTPPREQSESDLLAILAREAKEASEQLSKELNELNFDKPVTNEKTKTNEVIIEQIKESHQITPVKQIGKVVPHKPVKLNTFHITEDNKLENKQTIVTNAPGEIEGSTSMTDLLKELTRSLEFDFGLPKEESKEETEQNDLKNKTTHTKREFGSDILQNNDEVQDKFEQKNSEKVQTIERIECDEFFSSLEDNEKDSSPELSLFNSLCEEPNPLQMSPQNSAKFPLEIPDDSVRGESPPSSSDVRPLLPRDPRGCDDCSSQTDEGKTCSGACVSCVGRPTSLEAELLHPTPQV